jgi:hypothetical protein
VQFDKVYALGLLLSLDDALERGEVRPGVIP